MSGPQSRSGLRLRLLCAGDRVKDRHNGTSSLGRGISRRRIYVSGGWSFSVESIQSLHGNSCYVLRLTRTQACAVLFAWPLHLEQAGLTLATSVGACFNATLLLYLLLQKSFYHPQAGWTPFLAKVGLAVILLAVVVALAMGPSSEWLSGSVAYKVTRLAFVIAAGAVTYFGTLYALGFRLAHFNRREAPMRDAVAPIDDSEV